MSLRVITGTRQYELDIRDAALNAHAMRQSVWIVSIQDETGHNVTSSRIAGNQDDVTQKATEWLNALCRRNPGKFLHYVIRHAND
jgi:hypothetical protein